MIESQREADEERILGSFVLMLIVGFGRKSRGLANNKRIQRNGKPRGVFLLLLSFFALALTEFPWSEHRGWRGGSAVVTNG